MINPRELRIGNWLRDYYGIFRRVEYVGETVGLGNDMGGTDKYQHKPIFSKDLNDIHPIPLTESILIACGFKKRTYNYEYLFEEHSQMWFKYYSKLGAWQLEVDTSHEGGYETDIATIKSLHQLQNLFYCLTGEELIYKP